VSFSFQRSDSGLRQWLIVGGDEIAGNLLANRPISFEMHQYRYSHKVQIVQIILSNFNESIVRKK